MSGGKSFKQRVIKVLNNVELSDIGKLRRIVALIEVDDQPGDTLRTEEQMQAGEGRSVTFGGDVTNSEVITGDRNVVMKTNHSSKTNTEHNSKTETRITRSGDPS